MANEDTHVSFERAPDSRVLGARLQKAREARSITQQGAADALGMPQPTYIAIEKGAHPLQACDLIRVADLYGRSVHELLQPQESRFYLLEEQPEILSSSEEHVLPQQYVKLAVQSYEDGELTEGELMEILRTDRQRARQIVKKASLPPK